ncbi:unnamed protein product, partial [Allacma fusca]
MENFTSRQPFVGLLFGTGRPE